MKRIATAALFFIAVSGFAQTKAVRLPWQEFAKDPNRVQSFRNAVATMKARSSADPSSAEYRTSWEYWASMHGYFGTDAKAKTVAQYRINRKITAPEYDPYFIGVRDMTPPDATARAVWDQCQHGTDYFFPWHRLYLYYFEQVLQGAANDPSLRLPYWDYTDTANLGMPEEFRSPTYKDANGNDVPNPLFEARRAPGWEPPGTNALPPEDTDINNALDNPQFFNTTNAQGVVLVAGYQRQIERGVHGNVHCDVMDCPVTVMGAVPYSSNDPIFWLHHCNIDRMWDCWTSITGHKNPTTSAFLNQPFSYVDGTGALVTKLVKNLFDGSVIDYVYFQPKNCERPEAVALAAATPSKAMKSAKAALAKPMLIGETLGVKIDAAVAKKRITMPATASLSHPRQFALREQQELPITTELILRGVTYALHPRTQFRIYLERVDDPSRRAVVGTLSFFDGEHEGHVAEDIRIFDATDALRALRLEGTGTLNVNVVFEAAKDIMDDFDSAATDLTIREVELQVKRDL